MLNHDDNENHSLELELENAIIDSLEANQISSKHNTIIPDQLDIFPILRRPFFPGMAAPLVIEPGPLYEVIKLIAKSPHKCLGLVLTRSENIDVYQANFNDLFEVGVLARILRIIPMEQGGAQIILNMEKRLRIVSPASNSKTLKANIAYYEDNPVLTL